MRRLAATITLAILAVAVLAGCGSTLTTPNVVGLPLDKAHQAFEALGITEFEDKDAFEKRNAVVDSNWAVLGQDPAAGAPVDTDTKITLTIGKIGEARTTARLTEGSPVLAKIRAEAATQKADAERKAAADKAAAAKAVADKAAADKVAAAKAAADKAALKAAAAKATASRAKAAKAGAAPVTDAQVVNAFRTYIAERAAANVTIAKAVTDVSFSDRVLQVTFDPAAVGMDQETFDDINPFNNPYDPDESLADFVSTPILSSTDLGIRLRKAIDRIETVYADGTPDGARTTAEIIELNEL